MWLRDQLPRDFPGMRVMTYGYDTILTGSESFQNIDDLAITFINLLRSIGLAEYSSKPVILIAHSLGGLLVKSAIKHLASSGDSEHHMLSKVKQLIFFGVPHFGMHVDHLRTIVNTQPNQELVNSLAPDSKVLKILEDSFNGILQHRPIRLISIYETKRSPVAEVSFSPQNYANPAVDMCA